MVSEERYQIAEKAQWLRLSLLVDELESYRELRKLEAKDVDAWTGLLRGTRSIFVALHNVSEQLSHIHFSDEELIKPPYPHFTHWDSYYLCITNLDERLKRFKVARV